MNPMMQNKLTGTVAIITGASSGIGEAAAKQLAELGACTHESIGEELRAYDPGWVFTGTFAAEPDEAARGIAAVMRGELGEHIPHLMMQSVAVGAPAWHPLSPSAGYGLGVMTKGQPVTVVGHGGQGPGFTLFAAVSADGRRWSGRFAEGQGEDLALIQSCVDDVERNDVDAEEFRVNV